MVQRYYHTSLGEILEPGAVHALAWGRFTSPTTLSLFIVRSALTELYQWQPALNKLMLVSRTRFAGPVLEAVRVPLAKDGLDCVMVSLGESRYCTLVFDPLLYDLSTTSLHQYDPEKYRQELLFDEPELPINKHVIIEPSGRCAAVRVYREALSIIPFELIDPEAPISVSNDRLPSWIVKFADIDERLMDVLDWVFLDGYLEPTIGLLFRAHGRPAWAGRLATNRKDSMGFAIIAVDLRRQQQSVIHYQESLPNDLCRLQAVPKPVGGCFAIGISCFLYLDQGTTGCGFACNGFAAKLSDYRFLPIIQPLEITLEDCEIVHIASDTLWLILKDGQRFSVRASRGVRSVNNITVTAIPPASDHYPVSCHSSLGGMLALGSEISSTLVYSLSTNSPTLIDQQSNKPAPTTDLDDADLYLAEIEAGEKQRFQPADSAGHMKPVDVLPFFTLLSSTIGFGGSHPERPVNTRLPRQIVGIGGRSGPSDASSVFVCSSVVPIREITRFSMPKATCAFSVSRYLLVSTPSSTLVLERGQQEMRELVESDFFLEGRTLAVGTAGGLIVQVYLNGIRLLDGARMVEDISIQSQIISASIKHDHISIVSTAGDQLFLVNGNGATCMLSDKDCLNAGMFQLQNAIYYYRLSTEGRFSVHSTTDGIVFETNLLGHLPRIIPNGLLDDVPVKCPSKLVAFVRQERVFLAVSSQGFLAAYAMIDGPRFVKCDTIPITGVSKLEYVGEIRDGIISCAAMTEENKCILICIGDRQFPRFHAIHGSTSHLTLISESKNLLIVDKNSRVRICAVDDRCDLDRSDAAVIKSPLPSDIGEPSRIAYLPHANAYVLSCRQKIPFSFPNDEYAQFVDLPDFEYPSNVPRPQCSSYTIVLVSPITWSVIDRIPLSDIAGCTSSDMIVDLRAGTLSTRSSLSGSKTFIIVGIASVKGEDRPVRGRALVLDVTVVVPEPGRPETCRKLRLLASTDMKTTVGTVCALRGHLLVGQGARMILHSFEGDESLQGCAFVDGAIWASSAAALGSLFALGDVQRGVSLYVFQEEPPRVAQISRDLSHPTAKLLITSVEFIDLGDDCLIVAGDQLGNLFLYSFSPSHPRSASGSKLVPRGGTRLPSSVSSMERVLGRLVLTMADGSVCIFEPLDPAAYKRQSSIIAKASSCFPLPGGLHPRSAKSPRFPGLSLNDHSNIFPRAVLDRSFMNSILVNCSVAQLRQMAGEALIDFDGLINDLRNCVSLDSL